VIMGNQFLHLLKTLRKIVNLKKKDFRNSIFVEFEILENEDVSNRID
jgi:hypothetical protein